VSLVLVLAPRRGDVRVPALGHLAPRQLDRPLIERWFELQQQQCLFDVEDPCHD
jgi:hypothetical protein